MSDVNVPTQPEKSQLPTGNKMLRVWLPAISTVVIVIIGALVVYYWGFRNANVSSAPAQVTASAEAAPVIQVAMHNLQFVPATIEVKSGGAVEWTNEDIVPHNVTSPLFHSDTLLSGQSWRHTFTNAGNYSYACTFHPQMKGVVNVK